MPVLDFDHLDERVLLFQVPDVSASFVKMG